MILEEIILAKDFRTYKRIILRQDKSLRDHVPTRPNRCSPQGRKRRAVTAGRDRRLQRVGLSIEDIRKALSALPADRC